MREKLVPQRVLFLLIAAAVLLLIGGFVMLGLAALLAALGDEAGSVALEYIALGCGVLLVIDLVCLVLAQAVNSLDVTDDSPDEK